jgi:hypothetical protein
VKPIRPLFYGLLSILPNYLGIVGLFGVVLYAYSVATIIFVSTDRLLKSKVATLTPYVSTSLSPSRPLYRFPALPRYVAVVPW